MGDAFKPPESPVGRKGEPHLIQATERHADEHPPPASGDRDGPSASEGPMSVLYHPMRGEQATPRRPNAL